MTPERAETIGEYKVEEIYWAGSYPCYVNHRLSAESYDETVERLKRGEPPKFK